MGYGQDVSAAYMDINSGEPQPITVMNVGIGRWRSALVDMEVVSVRMYSWQFYGWAVSGLIWGSSAGKEEGSHTPQKKCRMKITTTRRATLGPVYRLLNGTIFPSRSSRV